MNQKLQMLVYFACGVVAGMLLRIAAEWLRRTL